MYDPITAAAIVTGVGAVIGAYGTLKQGHDAKVAGKNQQTILDYNARVAEQEAETIKQKAAYDAEIHAKKIRSYLSSQKAAYGASGLTFESGESLFKKTVTEGEIDRLAILYGGDIGALKAKSEAGGYRMSGEAYKLKGKNEQTSSYYQAGGTLLTGAGKAYGAYKAGSIK